MRRLVLILLLAACAPAPVPTAAPTRTLMPAASPESPPTLAAAVLLPAEAQAFVSAALANLADSLSVLESELVIAALDGVYWSEDTVSCEPGPVSGYRLTLALGDQLYRYRSGPDDRAYACDDALAADVQVTQSDDPLAAELVLMAQQRLATSLNLSARRIRLLSIQPMTWTDTSLNCPDPDAVYESVAITGYRLVLAAGDQQYIFHADFDRLVACPPDREQMPRNTQAAP